MNASGVWNGSVRWQGPVLRALGLLVLSAWCMACGPMLSTPEIASARRALDAAQEVQADRHAVYEYTLATEYLDKAREEWGQARYRKALAYAEKARVFAEEALRRAERSSGRGASDLDRRLP